MLSISTNRIGQIGFVGYHQDISIGVEKKIIANGYAHWTRKKDLLGVIPPVTILESIVTFRIHLDNVNDNNGALKIIEKSHQKGIIRIDENFDPSPFGREVICNARQGQVMLMKPLLLHVIDQSKSDRCFAIRIYLWDGQKKSN